ncbi:hypothetical protein [Pseudomonas putida]|uniref:hypothetical protein n=1 Tax=Pseudomonas putida TaxID=303 RepID=UPI0020C2B8C2|nr:hypothetical protein [Pseudomonas putida]UTL82544.1 hypothetical protein NL778_06990 [Pseudomonas putida]
MGHSTRAVSAAEQARQEVRTKRLLRSQSPDALPAPTVDKEFVADPHDMTIWGDDLRAHNGTPAEFRLKVAEWVFSDPVEEDELNVYADDSPVPFYTEFYSPTNKPPFPLQIAIPQERLDKMGDGPKTFNYTITSYNDNVAPSDKLTLLFDRVGPYSNTLPPKFADVADVIDTNKGAVKLQLPDYADRKAGDTVHVWWVKELVSPLPAPNISVPVNPAALELDVPLSLIESVGDGGVKVVYVLADKAGNYSSASDPLDVGVALGRWPSTFGLPEVDLASDGLIDQADVALGVEVAVPQFDNTKEGDEVRVHWGAKPSAWRKVGDGSFPMHFKIGNRFIWDEYGGAAGEGEVAVTVTYEVRRGTVPMLPKDNKSITFNVNLERIGPVDPDPDPEWPGPINGDLEPAEVYGAVSNTKNTLNDSDAGQPAKVVVPVDAAFMEGDVVTLFWRGGQVPGVDHEIATGEPGNEIEMSIPWSVIAAVGNGTIPMHYAIHRPDNPNGTQPEPTDVVVSGLVIRTPAPTYQGLSSRGFLNCQSIWSNPPNSADPALRVAVPDLGAVGFKVGDKVEISWRATVYGSDTPIPDVSLTDTIDLDDSNIGGFVWRIPYEDKVLPIYQYEDGQTDGNGYVSYKSQGGGTPIESDEVKARVSIHSAGITCDISAL